ncbi:39S ribosomal protein L24, mitochondrial [Pleurotus pulmonarius]|nr:39S ribosomal protein L24, mitochondrial [Pleurotus pulmonarius]
MIPSAPLLEAVSQPFKRAQLGLFQGKSKQYGNNVPFSKHKTRRTWLPNVQHKYLFSETLEQEVRLKITTRALKTIKKAGGLDNYVLNTRADLLAWEGMRVRLLVQQRLAERERELAASPGADSTSKPAADNAEADAQSATVPDPAEATAAPTESQPASQSLEDALAEIEGVSPNLAPPPVDGEVETTPVADTSTPASKKPSSPKTKTKTDLTSMERLRLQLEAKSQRAQQEHNAFMLGERPTLADARRLRETARVIVGRSDARTAIAFLQNQQKELQERSKH